MYKFLGLVFLSLFAFASCTKESSDCECVDKNSQETSYPELEEGASCSDLNTSTLSCSEN